MSLRKQKLIRKNKPGRKPLESEEQPEFETYLSQGQEQIETKNQQISKQAEEQEDLTGYKQVKPLFVPLKEIAYLEPEARQKLREDHPNIAQYVFLPQRARSKYFHDKNFKYNSVMQTPGNLPARKIEFKRTFQVRPFFKQQAPSFVRASKSFRDKYNQKVHYG